jgi:hypothetical protein
VLFIDDEQAEPAELHAALEQAMRADHDVGLTRLEVLQHLVDFARAAEARQRFDLDRPVGEAVCERLIVLLRQQRGRHEHRDLLAGLNRDEGCAQRDLGLAEADVAAHDAIHRLAAAEIGDDLLDRLRLVGVSSNWNAASNAAQVRLAGDQLFALAAARREYRSSSSAAVSRIAARLCASPSPTCRCRACAAARFGRRAGVAADEVECLHRHVQLVAVGVFEQQEFVGQPADVERREADEAADAVVLVHDRRARTQVGEVADDLFGIALGTPPSPLLSGALAEQLLFRDQCERGLCQNQAGRDRRDGDAELRSTFDESGPALHQLRPQIAALEDVQEHFAAASRFCGDQHAARKIVEETCELARRLFAAGVDAQSGRGARRKVLIGQGLRQRIELDARQLYPAQLSQPLHELVHRSEYSRGSRIGRSVSCPRCS